MVIKQTNKIKKLVDKICSGDFCCSDVGILFVWLRPNLQKGSPLLDLADFVAHNNKRDRGASYKYIHFIVESFIKAAEDGGEVRINPILFRKEKVISDVIKILEQIGLDFDKEMFKNKQEAIINCILELIDEIEIKFDNPKVAECFLKRDSEQIMFCFKLNLTNSLVRASSISFSLFA